MIKIDFVFFIALFLGSIIVVVFILYLLNNKWFLSKEKKINLKKIKCEICGAFSFLRSQSDYWRCPYCESLNKVKKATVKNDKSK